VASSSPAPPPRAAPIGSARTARGCGTRALNARVQDVSPRSSRTISSASARRGRSPARRGEAIARGATSAAGASHARCGVAASGSTRTGARARCDEPLLDASSGGPSAPLARRRSRRASARESAAAAPVPTSRPGPQRGDRDDEVDPFAPVPERRRRRSQQEGARRPDRNRADPTEKPPGYRRAGRGRRRLGRGRHRRECRWRARWVRAGGRGGAGRRLVRGGKCTHNAPVAAGRPPEVSGPMSHAGAGQRVARGCLRAGRVGLVTAAGCGRGKPEKPVSPLDKLPLKNRRLVGDKSISGAGSATGARRRSCSSCRRHAVQIDEYSLITPGARS